MTGHIKINYTDNTHKKSVSRELNFDNRRAVLFTSMFGRAEESSNVTRYISLVAQQMLSPHSTYQTFVTRLDELLDAKSTILLEEVSELVENRHVRVKSISDLVLLRAYSDTEHKSNIYLGRIDDLRVYVHDIVWFYNLSFIFVDDRYKVDYFEIETDKI